MNKWVLIGLGILAYFYFKNKKPGPTPGLTPQPMPGMVPSVGPTTFKHQGPDLSKSELMPNLGINSNSITTS